VEKLNFWWYCLCSCYQKSSFQLILVAEAEDLKAVWAAVVAQMQQTLLGVAVL